LLYVIYLFLFSQWVRIFTFLLLFIHFSFIGVYTNLLLLVCGHVFFFCDDEISKFFSFSLSWSKIYIYIGMHIFYFLVWLFVHTPIHTFFSVFLKSLSSCTIYFFSIFVRRTYAHIIFLSFFFNFMDHYKVMCFFAHHLEKRERENETKTTNG
jgi:hypothetical protein